MILKHATTYPVINLLDCEFWVNWADNFTTTLFVTGNSYMNWSFSDRLGSISKLTKKSCKDWRTKHSIFEIDLPLQTLGQS